MKSCSINNGKVVFDIDGKTHHFTMDAGKEILYFAMHYFTNEEIVESFSVYDQTAKLLKHLPGYQPVALEQPQEAVCPTCQRAL